MIIIPSMFGIQAKTESIPTLFEYLRDLSGDGADLTGKNIFSYLSSLPVDYLATSQFGLFDYLQIPIVNLSVSFTGSDTTLTWTTSGDITNAQFNVYKKSTGSGLITSSDLGTATLVATLANNILSYTFATEATPFLYAVAVTRGSTFAVLSNNIVNQQAVLTTISSSFNSSITTPYSQKIAATAYATTNHSQTLSLLAEAVFMYTFESGAVTLSSKNITAALPWKGTLQATQTTVANQPLLTDEGALFDGLSDVLSVGDNGDLGTTGNSIFAVVRPASLSVNQVIGGKAVAFTPATDGTFVSRISSSGFYSYVLDLGSTQTPTGRAASLDRQILVLRYDQAAGVIYTSLDGSSLTFAAVSTNFNTTVPYMIGGTSSTTTATNMVGTNWFKGYIEAYLHFSRPLSNAEANLVNNFLSNYKLG
jgi:hypothetical protein